jgi:hypothetical protein
MRVMKVGDEIKFHAQRILRGNPVTGVLIEDEGEWITVKLTRYIEGMANSWDKGDEKAFRKCLINGDITVIHAAK